MNVSCSKSKPLLGALIALAAAGAATPLLAATQAQASSTPVVATETPAAPGTGANPGDLARAEMQQTPQPVSLPMKPSEGPVAVAQPGSGAPIVATEQPAAPGTGANPGDLARAEMQAHPRAFPFLHG